MMSAGSSSTNFYPRPPRGGRLQSLKQPRGVVCISIHALREEGDFTACAICLLSIDISIHALREEGDFEFKSGLDVGDLFLSTPSARRAT